MCILYDTSIRDGVQIEVELWFPSGHRLNSALAGMNRLILNPYGETSTLPTLEMTIYFTMIVIVVPGPYREVSCKVLALQGQ